MTFKIFGHEFNLNFGFKPIKQQYEKDIEEKEIDVLERLKRYPRINPHRIETPEDPSQKEN